LMAAVTRRVLGGFGISALVAATQASVSAQTREPGRFRSIEDYLDQLADAQRFPGASVLVLQHGREVFFHAAGFADLAAAAPMRRDTIFRIYSMSKPITAAAIMMLVEEGRIGLHDPVSSFVPEFADLRAYVGEDGARILTEPARPMTVEHLLTHTSGLTYGFQRGTPVAAMYRQTKLAAEEWRFDPAFAGGGLARVLATMPLAYQPGTRWHYGVSFDIAGLIVERASGLSFADFLRQRIFDPLGMRHTGFWASPQDASRLASIYGAGLAGGVALIETGPSSRMLKPPAVASGGGGLLSTIDDYGRFAAMLCAGGTGGGRRILSRASVAAMMTDHVPKAMLGELPGLSAVGLGGRGEGLGFGYGGAVVVDTAGDGLGSVGEYAWGGAASTTFWVDPLSQLVAIFMTQLIPPGRTMVRDDLRRMVYARAP
jgi:CubicO group peptidase (beta-lactamase class C family)